MKALEAIFAILPADFPLPILVVEHLHVSDDGAFARHLAHACRMPVEEACDKWPARPGHVYTAPANYHLLVEQDGTLSLSVDERVNWSRPSIDVLFDSAARAWGRELIAVILSGASADGARGLSIVRGAGGRTIAQDPNDAESPLMPQSAIDAGAADEILSADKIGARLIELTAIASWKRRSRTWAPTPILPT